MIKGLMRLFQLEEGNDLTYEAFKDFEYDVWQNLNNNGVEFKKIRSNAPNQMLFITKMPTGSCFDAHYHSDAKEYLTLLSGTVLINDIHHLSDGESMTFHPKFKHSVKCLKDSTMLIEFTPTKKK